MKTVTLTCDICKKTYQYDDTTEAQFEIQEFLHIRFTGGYGSVFGDGDRVECDICQRCVKEKLGAYMRVKDGM